MNRIKCDHCGRRVNPRAVTYTRGTVGPQGPTKKGSKVRVIDLHRAGKCDRATWRDGLETTDARRAGAPEER